MPSTLILKGIFFVRKKEAGLRGLSARDRDRPDARAILGLLNIFCG